MLQLFRTQSEPGSPLPPLPFPNLGTFHVASPRLSGQSYLHSCHGPHGRQINFLMRAKLKAGTPSSLTLLPCPPSSPFPGIEMGNKKTMTKHFTYS